MSQTRTTYPGGPGFLTAGGNTTELAEDWKVEHEIMTAPIMTNLHGEVGKSIKYTISKLTAKPVATTSNLTALLSWLFPYTSDSIGSLVFPSIDSPGVIQTRDGYSITYAAAAITKMPDITFAGNVDPIGEFELTLLNAYESAPTSNANVVAVAASTYTSPSMNPLQRIRMPYSVALGSSGILAALETEKGVKFSPSLKTQNVETDLWGLVNMRVTGVDATATLTPMNINASDFFTMLQLENASGYSEVGAILGNLGAALTVTPAVIGGPVLTMPAAVCTKGPLQFSSSKSRVGEVTFVGQRASTSGVLGNNFSLSVRTS